MKHMDFTSNLKAIKYRIIPTLLQRGQVMPTSLQRGLSGTNIINVFFFFASNDFLAQILPN